MAGESPREDLGCCRRERQGAQAHRPKLTLFCWSYSQPESRTARERQPRGGAEDSVSAQAPRNAHCKCNLQLVTQTRPQAKSVLPPARSLLLSPLCPDLPLEIRLFMYSLNPYLLSNYSVPGTVLGTGDTVVTKT